MNQNSFKAHTPLLECIISLIFHIEQSFTPYVASFLPVLLGYVACTDWSTKKVAIDAIYSMSAIVKEEVVPFRVEVLQVLNHCRFDKVKPVRDATLETIKLLKEIGPPLDEEQLAMIDGGGKGGQNNGSGGGSNNNEGKYAGSGNVGSQGNSGNNKGNSKNSKAMMRSGSNSARGNRDESKKSFTEGSLSDEGQNSNNNKHDKTKGKPVAQPRKKYLKADKSAKLILSHAQREDNASNSDQDISQHHSSTPHLPSSHKQGKKEKKVSAATLKRRAAAAHSPLREQQNNMGSSTNK